IRAQVRDVDNAGVQAACCSQLSLNPIGEADWAEQSATLTKYLDKAPNNPALKATLGVAHYRAGRYEQAKSLLASVAAGEGHSHAIVTAQLFLAMTLKQLGETEAAQAQWQKALAAV